MSLDGAPPSTGQRLRKAAQAGLGSSAAAAQRQPAQQRLAARQGGGAGRAQRSMHSRSFIATAAALC